MEILLHTIVFEPARWTPKRVSLTLQEILPAIARTGLRKLEIYEHHLSMAADEGAHDHSIADSPERFVQMVRDIAAPNVGILYQPTEFEQEPAMRQLAVELPWIKHLHLQNRASGETGRFARLAEGVISWKEIFAKVAASGSDVSATLEFVPSGICPMEQFNLEQTLAEAVEEINFAKSL